MTATPVRADKKLILTKALMTGEDEDVEVVTKREVLVDEHGEIVYDENSKPKYRVEFKERKQGNEYFELQPDFEVERREAWKHAYLCRINRNAVEIEMTNENSSRAQPRSAVANSVTFAATTSSPNVCNALLVS